jgi:hypothetical protein
MLDIRIGDFRQTGKKAREWWVFKDFSCRQERLTNMHIL